MTHELVSAFLVVKCVAPTVFVFNATDWQLLKTSRVHMKNLGFSFSGKISLTIRSSTGGAAFFRKALFPPCDSPFQIVTLPPDLCSQANLSTAWEA